MTDKRHPTHQQLASAIEQFRSETVNRSACSKEQLRMLEKISTLPPDSLQVLKDGSRSLVGKHTLVDGTECVLKYYRPKNLAKKINYGLRGSRAMRSWIAARVFEYLGIPTPPAMILCEQKGAAGITLKRSFLTCRFAAGPPLSSVTSRSQLEQAAQSLRQSFGLMLAHRISHGDLKANNLIVSDNNTVSFIDLDGTSILSSTSQWESDWQRDRNRFLKNWPVDSPAFSIFSEVIPAI